MPNTDGNSTLWELIGSNQVAVIVTIIGIAVTVFNIYVGIVVAIFGFIIAIPSIKKHFKDKVIENNHSPYITGDAVTPPVFVGRNQELRLLDDSLLKTESISLLGNRRIGKSSLLETWQKYLIDNGYKVLLLDGQNSEGASLQAFLQTILKDAVDADISADDAANRLVQWAEQQFLLNQKKPVILVDECEAILQQCPHRFWERVRGALGQIIWVFSSKQPLDTLYKHHHKTGSPFENQLKTCWLGLLDNESAEKLIQKGKFSDEQQELLRLWAGYHPFYLQCLGGHLWMNKPAIDPTEALDAYKMETERHLNDLWRNLSDKEKGKLHVYKQNKQVIDDTALRSKGVITQAGHPFAKILADYLKEMPNV